MATGSKTIDGKPIGPLNVQGGGQSAGVPAQTEMDDSSYNPLGNPGVKHWQASYVTRPGLDDRSNIFFAAVEMTRMPMVVADARQQDTPIAFANRAFLDMTGYEEEQVLGRNCRFLQGPDTDPASIAEIRAALAEKRAVALDLLNYKADGSPFWNALFIGPVFDDHGELLYFFASQMDITRRRVSEQAFRQAQKMEAIGQLTAGLAHDFNNLLQVISGNLELAEHFAGDEPDAAQLRNAIHHAASAVEKGAKLTQQLLTFARKQRLEPRHVNLNALVVEFSEMLVRTLGDRVELRLDLLPGLPSCTVDPTHLEMALLNVLINARDAMRTGGRVVVATSMLQDPARLTAHNLPAGGYVMLCVVDEGEGMPPEVLQRATEPFFTTKGPGTGLGLAMVHGFVQQSHGRLELDSTPGKGTTVRMIFPVASGQPVPPAPLELPGQASAPRGAVQTILLAEDSDDVRHLADTWLRAQGYRVLAARSGEEALALLDDESVVDLLLTDVIMPGGMNGLALAERLRRRMPQLPVLLMTGYMDEIVKPDDAPSMDVITKPFRSAELAERVRVAIGRRSQGAPPPTPSTFRHEG
ncbi:MAG TPA: histidine kinase famiy protein [Noviherbaspirillum sp.]|jgi:PAS domain S-box-containing protein|uniref:histidine kinase famiy protein n=1 Tax=Noviherbaspirillum sp. TaxID=1926288 RepID=UPI002F91E945